MLSSPLLTGQQKLIQTLGWQPGSHFRIMMQERNRDAEQNIGALAIMEPVTATCLYSSEIQILFPFTLCTAFQSSHPTEKFGRELSTYFANPQTDLSKMLPDPQVQEQFRSFLVDFQQMEWVIIDGG
jgi:hypothetical protein